MTPNARLQSTIETELVTIEYFVACDPYEGPEIDEEPDFLAMVAGAVLGGMGFELLHHAMEGLEHVAEIGDALRPQIQRQQVNDAVLAYRRNPRPFALGETKGLWILMTLPRQVMRNVVAHTAPSRQVLAPVVQQAPRRLTMPPPRLRMPPPRPTWARA